MISRGRYNSKLDFINRPVISIPPGQSSNRIKWNYPVQNDMQTWNGSPVRYPARNMPDRNRQYQSGWSENSQGYIPNGRLNRRLHSDPSVSAHFKRHPPNGMIIYPFEYPHYYQPIVVDTFQNLD